MDNSLKSKDGLITCKACQREFGYILKHLSQYTECKNAYSHSEYEMLQKESKRITYENDLILKRSKYNKDKRAKRYQLEKNDKKWKCYQEKMAKKYQIQRKDESWMKERALKDRRRYDNQAQGQRHQQVREKEHKEKMENHIKLEKQKTCRQNESCKKKVTECLWRQVKNSRGTKSNR